MKPGKKMLTYLFSPVSALFLLILISILMVIGIHPAIKSLYDIPTGFFRSWLFLTLVCILFINLSLCTARQVNRLLRHFESFQYPLEEVHNPKTSPIDRKKVINLFRGKGFKCREVGEGEFICRKRYFGRWGSVIFHAGLIIICFGAFLEFGFSFKGRIAMEKGGYFEDRYDNYRYIEAGRLHRYREGKFALFLNDIKTKYKDDGVFSSADTSLVVGCIETARQQVAQGNPLKAGLLNIYFENSGYFAKIKAEVGNKEIPLAVGLSTITYPGSEESITEYSESLNLEGTPYRLEIEFIPDINNYKSVEGKSYRPDNPGIRLFISKITGPGQFKQVYNGVLPLGESVLFDKEARLEFKAFYPWVTFWAKTEPGMYVIYSGFLISLAGVLLLFIWIPEFITVKCVSGGMGRKLMVGGWTSRYKKDFQRRLNTIKREAAEFLLKEEVK